MLLFIRIGTFAFNIYVNPVDTYVDLVKNHTISTANERKRHLFLSHDLIVK